MNDLLAVILRDDIGIRSSFFINKNLKKEADKADLME